MTTRHLQWRKSAVIAALAAFAAGAGVLAQNPPAKQSVWDGVYTEAQAARGERQYGRSCEQCHGPDMSGDQVEEIPSLVLDSFMTDWNGKSVRELFETVKRSMPKDKPGSLGTGAYVDLVAYLLQANKFPSGAKELSRTPEQLEPIVIERGQDATGVTEDESMFGKVSIVVVAVSMCAGAVAVSAQQAAPAEKKIWDGVYTSAQAARGKEPFERSCARCHNVELAGSQRGPALKGTAFWAKYDNEGLSSLFMFIRDTMPQDGPSLLSDEIKADVLAYIMSMNGMPAGNAELKPDLRALDEIKIARKTTFDGVFTEAQAERGKQNFLTGRCGGCHKLDLTGDRGPTLKGDDFLAHWDNGSVATLFDKIRETMPPNSPNESTDDAKIDIVAYLLQQNNFPVGKTELRADADALGIIDLVRKGATTTIPNFSLVQVVGCLTQAPNKAWTLTSTSEPVLTRDEEPTAAALRTSQGKALGAQTFQLVSVVPFKPEGHLGHKMEARGLLYKDQADARINLTSLQMLGAACGT